MRVSVNSRDPGFDKEAFRRVSRVTCDGAEVPMAVTADTEQGYVEALQSDGNGGLLRDHSGDFILVRLTGLIEIEMNREARAWDKNRTGSVKVRVGRDANKDILVQVYSFARPGAIKQMRLPAHLLPTSDWDIVQKCGAAAGAAAEMLCDQFGDRIDPSSAAATAVQQASLLLRAEVGSRKR